MQTATHILDEADILLALESVKDPEIPVLSLLDMGMITKVLCRHTDGRSVAHIVMTPTFVGCPALGVIKNDIIAAVSKLGFDEVEVIVDMETSWTSDRMSPEAKLKLEQFGIAPPATCGDEELSLEMLDRVRCPHCGSTDTTLRSSFGSTLCRAIRFCFSCKQGFEQFKPV